MEAKDINLIFFLEAPIFIGTVSPIRTKFMMLKIEPNIRPFPKGLWLAKTKKTETIIETVMAIEQYFF